MKYFPHRCSRVATAGIVTAIVAVWTPAIGSAANDQQLLVTAMHNTNTVRTLVYQSVETQTLPAGTVTTHIQGEEDEVRNREHDTESVSVTAAAANGKTRHVHYTAEVIFVGGRTYYRVSLLKNQWKNYKGTQFQDPNIGIGFSRNRTTVSFSPKVKFTQVGRSGSLTQYRANTTAKSLRTRIDLWVSGGATPYVMREEVLDTSTKNSKATRDTVTRFTAYNQPVIIEPPTGPST